DPRRTVTAAPVRLRCRRRRVRRRAGDGRARLSLRAPLSGASPSPSDGAAPDRSADSRADRLSRPHQPHDQGDLMNLVELDRALRQLRLGGMATVLESRLVQAQTERMAPIDLISVLVSDELRRRADRLLERRTKHAHFRDGERTLDNFDFDFNKKMNRRL